MSIQIPSEGIGSIPRPQALLKALSDGDPLVIKEIQTEAIRETIQKLIEITNYEFPISDGEQSKPSFVTYPITGLKNLQANGVVIPFKDGHTRQLPAITSGPFEYGSYAVEYFKEARSLVKSPLAKLKQAVIAPSAISLLYPVDPIENYSREEFIGDVIKSGIKDIRFLLDEGADIVQVDFTEGRLSLKLDPSGGLLKQFLDINDTVFKAFTAEERSKIGIHVCPGADLDSTHSDDVDYTELIPSLFSLSCGRFYFQMKSEKNPEKALQCIKENIRNGQRVFIGVIDVNNPRIESSEEVSDFIEKAAQFIPINQLGTCDDCGFSPFADDSSTSREIAFAKICARIEGTKLASSKLSKST